MNRISERWIANQADAGFIHTRSRETAFACPDYVMIGLVDVVKRPRSINTRMLAVHAQTHVRHAQVNSCWPRINLFRTGWTAVSRRSVRNSVGRNKPIPLRWFDGWSAKWKIIVPMLVDPLFRSLRILLCGERCGTTFKCIGFAMASKRFAVQLLSLNTLLNLSCDPGKR